MKIRGFEVTDAMIESVTEWMRGGPFDGITVTRAFMKAGVPWEVSSAAADMLMQRHMALGNIAQGDISLSQRWNMRHWIGR